MIIQPGHFKWKCANVLIGVGDSFSFFGAQAFKKAAEAEGIDICLEESYQSKSSDVSTTISNLKKARCCKVIVVFAQVQDYRTLLLEARKQKYAGQWFFGSNVGHSVENILKDAGPKPYELLKGTYMNSREKRKL